MSDNQLLQILERIAAALEEANALAQREVDRQSNRLKFPQ